MSICKNCGKETDMPFHTCNRVVKETKQYLGDGVYAEYNPLGELKLIIPSENTEDTKDIVIILGWDSQVSLGIFLTKSIPELKAHILTSRIL